MKVLEALKDNNLSLNSYRFDHTFELLYLKDIWSIVWILK
jgi:hypothetical protein